MNEREFREKLPKLLAHWSSIEASIKQAELLHSQVPIPAINELRYAGRQLVRAFSIADKPEREEDLAKAFYNAEQYLINADHDVTDAMVVYVSRRVSDLNLQFGRKSIELRNPDYARLNDVVEICRSEIRRSRANLELRSEIYVRLKNQQVPLLIALFDELQNSDAMMSAEIALRQFDVEAAKLKTLYYKTATIVLVLTLLAVIAYATINAHFSR